jgi:methylated-DNA-[protein]-cysteine S-methyltransferase
MTKKKAAALYFRKVPTAWGDVHVVASATGVVAVSLPGAAPKPFFARVRRKWPGVLFLAGKTPALDAAAAFIRGYLAGTERRPSSVPFHIRVTPFQFRVLEVISAIPRGKTLTYGAVAAKLGKPNASRAVGGACAANPIPLLLPCHRVVGAGGPGGFAGGPALKRRLLALEQEPARRLSP